MKKVSLIAFSSICFLLLNSCSQKPNLVLNVNVNQSCKEPIVFYQFDYIAKGEFNHLNFEESTIKSLLKTALETSGCFKEEAILDDNVYSLEVLLEALITKKHKVIFLAQALKMKPLLKLN